MSKIQTLRSLIRELRCGLPKYEKVHHSPVFSYVMEQYRKNAVTDQQYCREQEEMAHLAQTCVTYLESSRRYEEIRTEYHSKGERSIEQTANMVGFKLPIDPQ